VAETPQRSRIQKEGLVKKIARVVGTFVIVFMLIMSTLIAMSHLTGLEESKYLTRMACAQQGYFGGTAYGWRGMHQICYVAVNVSLDEQIIFELEEVW